LTATHPSALHRIDELAQAVAKQVEAEHDDDQAEHWQRQHPPGLMDHLPPFGDHAAPGRKITGDGDADKRQDRLYHDGDTHLDR
jgi:hypothetical protein